MLDVLHNGAHPLAEINIGHVIMLTHLVLEIDIASYFFIQKL